jgi:hypothetical protein
MPTISYEKLGRAAEEVLVKDYIEMLHSTRRQIWSSFVRGIFFALGGIVGTTLVLGLVVATLNFLGGAPLIGHYLRDIGNAIQSK